MNCPNCNAQLDENAKFCPYCGTKLEAQPQTAETEQLNAYTAQDTQENVQAAVPQAPVVVAEQTASNVQETQEEFTEKGKSKKKYFLIGAAVIAVIAVIAVLLIVFMGGKGKSDNKVAPTLYTTDSELYVIKSVGKKNESILITDDYAGSYELSDNYEYIVYTEDYNEKKFTRDIYFKKLMDEKSEPVLIAKDATYVCAVKGNIDSIFYKKDDAIYVSDNKGNSEKLVKDATFEYISNNGKTLYYTTTEEVKGEYNDYYDDYDTDTVYTVIKMNVSDKKTTELTKNADRIRWNDDYTKLYALSSSNKLTCIDTFTGKSSDVADKVEDMSVIGNTLYYGKIAKEYSYTDFVTDTYAEADSKLSYPDWDDYRPDWEDYAPDWDAYDDYDAYWDAYDAANEKYYDDYDKAELAYDAAYDAYYEAEDRIYLREELEEDFDNYKSYTLYRYDGSKSTAILENASDAYVSSIYDISENAGSYAICSDKILADQYKNSLDSFEKVDITSIDSVYDLEETIEETADEVRVIVSGTTVISLETGKDEYIGTVTFDSSASEFYFLMEVSDTEYGELYSLSASAKSFSDAKKIASDVYTYANVNGTFTYFDDIDEKSYECTANYGSEKITDVVPVLMTADGINGFLYFSDVDEDDGTASLYCYSKGESKLIADDIYSSFAVIDGKFIVIEDYREKSGGDLVCIDGKDSYDINSRVKDIYNTNVKQHSIGYGYDY